MGRSKRPLPEEFKTTGSTDDLCRAVKRLHTYSQDASCTTASKEGDLAGRGDEEASSSLNSERRPSESQPDAGARSGEQSQQGASGIPTVGGDTHRLGKAQRALPPGLNSADFDERDEDGRSEQEGEAWLEEGVREGLANIDVTRGLQREGSVPQPGTPSREEAASPSAKKGHRLGTREGGGGHGYDELYEEANNLLKNLHFEWLHRRTGQN